MLDIENKNDITLTSKFYSPQGFLFGNESKVKVVNYDNSTINDLDLFSLSRYNYFAYEKSEDFSSLFTYDGEILDNFDKKQYCIFEHKFCSNYEKRFKQNSVLYFLRCNIRKHKMMLKNINININYLCKFFIFFL